MKRNSNNLFAFKSVSSMVEFYSIIIFIPRKIILQLCCPISCLEYQQYDVDIIELLEQLLNVI